MTLAVAWMFCVAAVARAVARVAAWGELGGGEPAVQPECCQIFPHGECRQESLPTETKLGRACDKSAGIGVQ